MPATKSRSTMSNPLTSLVDEWVQWLNRILANPTTSVVACRAPQDPTNEDQTSATKANIYIHVKTTQRSSIPTMVGLVCPGSPNEDDKDILANDVLDEQMRLIGIPGPVYCFTVHGCGHLTVYSCSFSPRSEEFDMDTIGSFDRIDPGQTLEARDEMMGAISSNVALVARVNAVGRG